MTRYILNTPEEMFALGESLVQEHPILFIEWELWAGKTTLIKWFAQWLGIDATTVTSPTYTYIQEYSSGSSVQSTKDKVQNKKLHDKYSEFLQNNSNSKKLLHIDMYNIHSFDELVEKGISELVHEYDYVVIERPKFADQLGVDGLSVRIEKLWWDKRKVYIK